MTGVQRTGARNVSVVLLMAVGALTAIGGAIAALAAKAAADHATGPGASMPTLPVHAYTRYAQNLVAPDYSGVWITAAVAVLGVVLLTTGIALVVRPRPRRLDHGRARA